MTQESKTYELNYTNLGDAIFIKLKEAILNGTLKPGQKLQQVELSQKYDVNRAPVRDALRKLEDEGLVTLNRKGVQVISSNLDEVHQLYQIREVLEDLAAYKAFPHISDETMMALKDTEKKMEKASREGDMSSWWELDRKFHHDSYKPCNSPVLLKWIVRLWNSTYQARSTYYGPPSGLPWSTQRSENNHKAQVAAIAARDHELYRSLIKKHLNDAVAKIDEVAPTRSSVSLSRSSIGGGSGSV